MFIWFWMGLVKGQQAWGVVVWVFIGRCLVVWGGWFRSGVAQVVSVGLVRGMGDVVWFLMVLF